MKIRKEDGFTMSDITIAIIILLIFVGLITGMIFNAWFSNMKAQRDGVATIYLSQQLENIAISNYAEVSNRIIEINDGNDEINQGYTINQEIIAEAKKNESDKGVKKVKATITYYVGTKKYEKSMERLKIEE